MQLTEAQVKQLLPTNKNIKAITEIFNELLPKYDINTTNRIAGFIAQCAHESMNFTTLKENLNYSAKGLRATFPKYFPTDALALQYEKQPEKIANYVYGNRLGNGDANTGDGFKYRGRGAIQLTGKANYEKFATNLNETVDDTVTYLETLKGAIESACWFWKTNKLNELSDKDDLVAMTKKINGGTIGLTDRSARYTTAKRVIG